MGIKAVTRLSVLSASLQFRLTQFGGTLLCLPHSAGALCAVAGRPAGEPRNDCFDTSQDPSLRTTATTVIWATQQRKVFAGAPAPRVGIRKGGGRSQGIA